MQYAVALLSLAAVVLAGDYKDKETTTTSAGWEALPTTTTTSSAGWEALTTTTTSSAGWAVYTTTTSSAGWEAISSSKTSGWEVVSSKKSTPAAETWATWSAVTTPAAASTTWATWATSAKASTTPAVKTYAGAANKGNMVGGAAVGLAAIAFML